MIRKLELTVEGMKNSRCEMAVKHHFGKYTGVLSVEAIKELDKVEIRYDSELVGMEEAMKRLNTDTSYKLVEVLAESEA